MTPDPSTSLLLFESLAMRWYGDRLELLDQRLLPTEKRWLQYVNADTVAKAITDMVVRGAPAIAIAAAYGVALEARKQGKSTSADSLTTAFDTLAASRPTAVNLSWALARMRPLCKTASGFKLADRLAREALAIHREDQSLNRRLATAGAQWLVGEQSIYTHCNTGALATGGLGTALGIIRTLHEEKRLEQVYAGETRPWLQGSRLTAWELQQDALPVTLVVDSVAASLMQQGKITAVIVGADRITANGDTANKIGTYSLAVLARHHGLPFVVAAPLSTIDMALPSGSAIPIEERNADEVRQFRGQVSAPANVPVYNPAFDVTPASLISAIVTEAGVIESPSQDRLQRFMQDSTETH
jgi:methylthioribose-1-phosphate isomerase